MKHGRVPLIVHIWFRMLFFPPLLFNRKSLGFLDCFTGQSPGIGRNELAISMPLAKSKPELLNEGLGGGWARGVGLASARSWLLGGSFPSTLVRSVQPWSRGLAAKACKAAGVNWAVHRLMRAAATECWTRRGACWAFARAKILTKLAASSLHLPPVSMPRTTRRHRWLRKSSGYVRSFLRRASVKAVARPCAVVGHLWCGAKLWWCQLLAEHPSKLGGRLRSLQCGDRLVCGCGQGSSLSVRCWW